ncbi:maltooligosyl trehalose hydrolase [Deinococcus reticulitermitis]|uniref:Malto-oligosyltrehalose trehalohydrolase n=1 Tax=Deinococcus reticulitermitis TaxID=856736 RepID=A0A1H7CLY2_9DEIO|nr:malto-oligosyltrehalose trehalohydrolase [Deinococcus reticulitermitis]SEJ88132.1 maltooligosyl trehalose hydrolase [Deinococcus reticulitermitis]
MTQTSPSVAPTPDPAVPDALHTRLGAQPLPEGGTRFRLWTTRTSDVAVRVNGEAHAMSPQGGGLFELDLPVGAGARYLFLLGGVPTPDPYARFLPDGVHGEAEVTDLGAFEWKNTAWRGLPLAECVFYELHVGTFTPEGTYRAARERLPYLRDLGVTALQVMPLAAFAGERGWGYDGVALYAPFAPYGRPEELQAFVDAAHGLGMAVLLDVVYNHFGPDGNYLASYAPSYFTDRFQSAWGAGLDYAEPHMRRLVTGNARMWLRDYRFDGLRLDATQAMTDDSEVHILRELAHEVHKLGGTHLLLAEDHRNLPTLVTEDGLDGIWSDDFHHEVRVTLTGEREGYYHGYLGGAADLAHTIRRGWRYEGQHWDVRGEEHLRGHPSDPLEAPAFVYCIQNHDQVGNQPTGQRLNAHPGVTPAEFRGASTLLLTLPMTPLLFQGQEWAASTPFQFFSDHAGDLGRAVSEGRRREFAYFSGFSGEDVPDPQAEETFLRSKLNWDERAQGEHAQTLALYRELLALRRSDPVLANRKRGALSTGHDGDVLWVKTETGRGVRLLLWNLGEGSVRVEGVSLPFARPEHPLLHSEGRRPLAPGALPDLGPGEALLLGAGA